MRVVVRQADRGGRKNKPTQDLNLCHFKLDKIVEGSMPSMPGKLCGCPMSGPS